MSPHAYGLKDLTAKSLADFRDHLADPNQQENTLAYLSAKMGFDPNDPNQFEQALDIYADKNLITTKKHKTGEFICQMHKSATSAQYAECTASANSSNSAFL